MDPNMRPRSGVKRERKCVSRAERIWRGDQSVFEVLRSQSEFGENEKERGVEGLSHGMGETYAD